MRNYYLDGMMGLVVGDALGVPVEFASREELKNNPVTDMEGYGTYPMPAGAWSDDSSMALATLASLSFEYDLEDIMNNFVAWEQEDEFTPTGEMFDEGNTCSSAIWNYMENKDVKTCGLSGAHNNGNGSLMRILPMCIYLYYKEKMTNITETELIQMIHDVSALTHAHLRSKMACGIYYHCVKALIDDEGTLQQRLQKGIDNALRFYGQDISNLTEISYFGRIMYLDELKTVPESDIRSGGYVIESIEAALWCLITTDTYKDCVLKAVNLGDDTDTTAAITGGLAGIYYGYENIPDNWKETILQRDWIEDLCNNMTVV